MVTAAAIGAAGAVAGGALASSGGKKGGGGGGEDILGKVAAQLYQDTTEHREITLDRALQALMGVAPEEVTPLVQRRRATVGTEMGQARQDLVAELSRLGLRDSSVGVQEIDQFNRDLRRMLTEADLSELERLMTLGEQIGFGVLDPTISAAKTSSYIQAEQAIAAAKMQQASGAAVGKALSSFLTQTLNKETPTATNPVTSPTYYDAGPYGGGGAETGDYYYP